MNDQSTIKSPPEEWRVGQIEVKNWRSVRHIIWTPLEGWNVVTGENEAGKTQLLAAFLSSLLGGSPGADVVRHGKELAEVRTRLDSNREVSLYVEKLAGPQFPAGWKLQVRHSPEGKALSDGQTVLNRIVGAMVDPSKLAMATPEKRVEMVLKALGLGDQLHELDVREKHLTSKREDEGRKSRDKQGELEGIPVSPDDTPTDFVNTAALLEEKNQREGARRLHQAAVADHAARCQSLEAAKVRDRDLDLQIREVDSKTKIERGRVAEFQTIADKATSDIAPVQCRRDDIRREIETLQGLLRSCEQSISELSAVRDAADREVKSANGRMVQLHQDGAALQMKVSEHRPLIAKLEAECAGQDPKERVWPDEDTSEIDVHLSSSKEVNAAVANNKRRAEVTQAKHEIDAAWDRIDGEIKALKDERAQLLANASWPYPGMAFGNGDIAINGSLWANLSRAEVAKVSTAFAIAMNPLLKTVVITDAAWFTPKTKAIVRGLAEEAHYQAIVEIPGQEPDATLIISDGTVLGATESTTEKELIES